MYINVLCRSKFVEYTLSMVVRVTFGYEWKQNTIIQRYTSELPTE